MKIFVTGAAGFVAYHIITSLLNEGHEVVGVDNFISGQHKNIELLTKNKLFSFFEADILTLKEGPLPAQIEQALKGTKEIYHLACPASPPTYQKDPLHTLETCVQGSQNILNLALKHKARILIASTSEIYGDPLVHPQPEDYRGNTNTMGPRACYDEGKRAMETLGYIYAQKGVEVRTARIFNTYGPRMSPHDGRVITNFILQGLQNQPLTVYGDGSQTRSFCFVSDLVAGLRSLMASSVTEPVNLGSQFEFSILDIAQTVRALINPKLELVFHPLPKDDPKQRRPNTGRAKEWLNWDATVTLKEGLSSMIAFMAEELNAKG
jgi:UDP-glucuronate decarboxylase